MAKYVQISRVDKTEIDAIAKSLIALGCTDAETIDRGDGVYQLVTNMLMNDIPQLRAYQAHMSRRRQNEFPSPRWTPSGVMVSIDYSETFNRAVLTVLPTLPV